MQEVDEQSYNRRLSYAIDWAARDPHGQFLLQHLVRLTGLFTTAGTPEGSLYNDGRRSVGIEFLDQCKATRNGQAIVKSILAKLIDTDFEEEGDEDNVSYNPIGNGSVLER